MFYKLAEFAKRMNDTMKKADINDPVDVTEKALECTRDTIKEVSNVSPFLGPTDPIQDVIKPDVVSPLIDPVFERLVERETKCTTAEVNAPDLLTR